MFIQYSQAAAARYRDRGVYVQAAAAPVKSLAPRKVRHKASPAARAIQARFAALGRRMTAKEAKAYLAIQRAAYTR